MTGSVYLDFVKSGIELLWEHQSLRLGDNFYSSSPLCITITSLTNRDYLSLGSRKETGFHVFRFPGKTPDPRPTRLDLAVWTLLEQLSAATGEDKYQTMVDNMSGVFADYGFDPRSGLAYWGQEAEFDVVKLGPETNWGRSSPRYKPAAGLPLEIMWRRAEEKMTRLAKSAYYGLITNPENMDFNRFCCYGFDDWRKKPSMDWQAGHRAFATTGAWLIATWVDHYCRTGDPETLEWARRMTIKWQKVQNPNTGLIPHFFGSTAPEQTTMTAQPYCDVDDSFTALALLQTGRQLALHRPGHPLAEQLREMGRRLITGLARFAYDQDSGRFRQWLRLTDGTEDENALCYTFRTEEQKEKWLKIDPELKDIAVFKGFEFYRGGISSDGTALALPLHLTQAAEITRDGYLLRRAEYFTDLIMKAAGTLTGPRNDDDQWTYDATAGYIKMFLLLHRLTEKDIYLSGARRLADMEIEHLKQQHDGPAWWQMPYRNEFLKALLELAKVTDSG